ncbi:MAG: DUF2752 domain-containing protein [Duncaniella sp.]|nr:DUF2752 domain-containing protein [Duncaniella sp.]
MIYYMIDPVGEGGRFMPKCTMKALTGWECPGCGFQRAVHALLHGQFIDAFLCNPFLWLVIPYVVALVVSNAAGAKNLYSRLSSPTACYIYIAAYFGWWILRNVIGL